MTGVFRETVDFDPTDGFDFHTATRPNFPSVFVTCLKTDGSYNWTRSLGATEATGVASDNEGSVWIGGYFQETVDFDPDIDEDARTVVGDGDIYVMKMQETSPLPPYAMQASGQIGETRPFTGYVDSRAESTTGEFIDLGISEVVFVFNEPVRAIGGSHVTPASFAASSTGGEPPTIGSVDDSENPLIRITLDTSPPLNEWTTITAIVEDLCGNPIESLGDLGPGVEEPDRIDFLFLPGDVDQSGEVGPFDLLRFRQIVNEIVVPTHGTPEDYVDTNRTGEITPFDLLMYRQLINGTVPATRVWAGETANHPQP